MKAETLRAFAVAGGVFVAGAVAVPCIMRSSFVMDPLTRQVEDEERANARHWNEENLKRHLALSEFTGDRPVRIVRLEDGGAIVENEHGGEMFARPDGVTIQVGERRWLSASEDGPMITSLAE